MFWRKIGTGDSVLSPDIVNVMVISFIAAFIWF